MLNKLTAEIYVTLALSYIVFEFDTK